MRCLHLPAFAGEGRDGGAQGAASWRLRWWEVGRWPENMGTGGNGSNIPNWKFFWIDPDVCCCFSRVDKKIGSFGGFLLIRK